MTRSVVGHLQTCSAKDGMSASPLKADVRITHGVPRTNEDKRRAVMKLLQGAEWYEP
jgi:hypothetical protein